MAAICKVFGKTRQAYYDRMRHTRKRNVDEELIVHHVLERRRLQPKEGVRKLLHNLQPILSQEGIKIGRDRFIEILRKRDLLVKRKRRGKRTTNSEHPFYMYPNLIKDRVVES